MNMLAQFWKEALIPLLIVAGYVAAGFRPVGRVGPGEPPR